MLIERCLNPSTSMATFSDNSVYGYNSTLGMPVAREATAYFLARRFLFPDDPSLSPNAALQHIQPKHVALMAGAAAVLNNLFFVLGEVGDACLIPTPYYTAFENDMNLVANIVPFPIGQANPMQGPTESELSLAFMQAKSSGLNPRFLLLTNPNNPLAVIYRPDVLLRCVAWARKRKMHTIVDEIYALSTHQVRRRQTLQVSVLLARQWSHSRDLYSRCFLDTCAARRSWFSIHYSCTGQSIGNGRAHGLGGLQGHWFQWYALWRFIFAE
jgi:aspartate/methionine/tyrosine aminotransferase